MFQHGALLVYVKWNWECSSLMTRLDQLTLVLLIDIEYPYINYQTVCIDIHRYISSSWHLIFSDLSRGISKLAGWTIIEELSIRWWVYICDLLGTENACYSVAEKLSWFIRHLSDELYTFYSNLWNLSSDIWPKPSEMSDMSDDFHEHWC